MSKDRVVEFKTPVQAEDPLTELLRMGSQKLIAGAVEAEFAELLSQYAGRVDGQGRRAVVRNG
ncbi:MAG: IS256 family transposase, partial [Nitrospinota bacterium]